MSNTRYLLGGAAVLGASYYVYQTRLEQSRATAISQDSLKNKIPGFGSGSSVDPREGPAEHAGRKIDEAAYDARGRFADLKDDANKKLDSNFAAAEREKAKLASWTSGKISDAQDRLDETVAHSKEKADAFAKDLHKDDLRGLNKLGHEIKSGAEDAKDAVIGTLGSAKNSIVGSKNKAEDHVSGAYNNAKSTANDLTESAQNKAEETKNSWFSWGSSKKDEAKESIDAAYDEAQKIYDDSDKRYREAKSSWQSWGGSKKKQLHDEAEQKLNDAQKNLEAAKTKSSRFFGSVTSEDADRANEFYTGELLTRNRKTGGVGFYDWLRGGNPSPTDEEILARGTSRGLRGWGESAEQFSREEYEDARRTAGHSTQAGSWGLSNWFGKKSNQPGNSLQPDEERIARGARAGLRGWGENAAQFADDEVEEAKGYVSKASDKLENSKNSSSGGLSNWFGSSKSDEQIARDAREGLKGWGESAAQFANDEADEAKMQATKFKKEYDSKLREWSTWGNKKYDENAKGAQEFYDDAQKQLETVQKDINDNAKHWWSWGQSKGEELESQSKKSLQDAELRLKDASSNLQKWTSDKANQANLAFWSSADNAVHNTKSGIRTANEKAQDGLNDASSWIKENKK